MEALRPKINRMESGIEYGFRSRLVGKEFVIAEDCQDEYEGWSTTLDPD